MGCKGEVIILWSIKPDSFKVRGSNWLRLLLKSIEVENNHLKKTLIKAQSAWATTNVAT